MTFHHFNIPVMDGRKTEKHIKSFLRLRTAAILLSAAVFSFAAIPLLLSNFSDGALASVASYIRGDFTFGLPGVASETEAPVVATASATVIPTTVSSNAQHDETSAYTVSESVSSAAESCPEPRTVQAVNLSRYAVSDIPKLILMNETSYTPDLKEFSEKAYEFSKPSGNSPLVLVVHTHGTESYLPDGVDTYDENTKYRSTDADHNVVGIGTAFCKELESQGIGTVHDVTMHDLEDFNKAYSSSGSAIRKYLQEYPTVKYVIDIHRDTVFTDNRDNQKPIVYINGEATAQVMLVVGTDEAGGSHKNWQTNLTLASKLQVEFNKYPTFARPVYLRKATYNQQYSKGALLLEIGSCGNTVTEARRAAVLAASLFAKLIKNG